MKKLSLFAMAASSTVLVPAAMAQNAAGAAPHGGARMGAATAGHSWREGGFRSQMNVAAPQVRHGGGGHVQLRQHRMSMGGHQVGGKFGHIRRIDRGGMLPRAWFGPRHQVRNWNLYGFSQPFGGGHWVRYYDDALLVDPYGRVLDGRYGVNWDVEGERWGYDDNGVPVYAGEGDFQPGQDDYDYAEDYERGDRDGDLRDEDIRDEDIRDEDIRDGGLRDEEPVGNGRRYTYAYPGYARPGCNCAGYGYGYGYGPVLVTETIVTTAPVMESVTRYEYVKERVKQRPVYRTKTKLIRRSK